MGSFADTNNKVVIRQEWDLPFIKRWSEGIARRLSYFGLPGPLVEDLLAWEDYIERSTGVEKLRTGKFHKDDLEVHRRLHKNISLNEIRGFQLLRGDIETIILTGLDVDNHRPQESTNDHPLLARFCYDLVNLDFCGGMGGKDKSDGSRRVNALKKLLERQQKTNFLFLLTINVRDSIDEDITNYLLGAAREAANNQLYKHQEVLSWYTSLGEGMRKYRLKALVSLFIRHEAERWGFDCYCYPPVSYEGSGHARMVHFVFELTHTTPILHAHSKQSTSDIIDLPLLEVENSQITILSEQHPNFDLGVCDRLLRYLPDELTAKLLLAVETYESKISNSMD